jgi:hypothetical protein
MELAHFVEQISDDFQSTFTVVDSHTLSNMLFGPNDFEPLTTIIKKYVPNATLTFYKMGLMDGPYDLYLIKDISTRSIK